MPSGKGQNILPVLAYLAGILLIVGCRTTESGSSLNVGPGNTSSMGGVSKGKLSNGPMIMHQCDWAEGPGPIKTRLVYHARPRGYLVQRVNRFLGYSINKSEISLNQGDDLNKKPLPPEVSAPDSAACVSVKTFVSPKTLVQDQRLLLPVGLFRPTNDEEIGALPTGSYVPFRIFSVKTKVLGPLESLAAFCGGKNSQIRARQEQDVTIIQGVFEDLPFLLKDSLKTTYVSDDSLRHLVDLNPAYIQEITPSDLMGPTPKTFVGWPLEWRATGVRFQDRQRRMRTEFEFTLLNQPFGASCESSDASLEVS
jgi:hypothetical protein